MDMGTDIDTYTDIDTHKDTDINTDTNTDTHAKHATYPHTAADLGVHQNTALPFHAAVAPPLYGCSLRVKE